MRRRRLAVLLASSLGVMLPRPPRPVEAAAPATAPRTWSSLRRAIQKHCAHTPPGDFACDHLRPALHKFPKPLRLEWHDADAQSPLPWVQFADPDPDWPEYDWFVDYTIDARGRQLHIQKLGYQFTP